MPTKSKIFLICCFAFIVGVAVASFTSVEIIQNDLWWFSVVIGSGAVLILFWKKRKKIIEGEVCKPRLQLFLLIILFLFLGVWRYSLCLPADDPSKIWYYNNQIVTVIGVVGNEPDVRDKNIKLEIDAYSVETQNFAFPQNVSGKILVTTNLYPRYNYGDELEIICNLQAPEKFQGFAYDRYLARYDIYSVCYYPLLRPLGCGEQANYYLTKPVKNGLPSVALAKEGFYKKIFGLKNKFRTHINFGLGEPEASLAKAIFLGDKKAIPNDLREKFSQAGISHIAAISGMHISILAGLVMVVLFGAGMSRKKAFWLSAAFLFFYILMIGLPASAMRAGLMGFLFLWAMNLGRLNKITNSIVLAAVALLIINPKLLRDDIGFQLSFLAVIGIIYFYPIMNNFFDKFNPACRCGTKLKGVRDIFAITIAAQITTLPIIALNFSQVSLIAPISNLLILWTLPLLITAGIIAIILSLLFPSAGFLFFLPAGLLLKYIIIIAERLVELPYAFVEVNYLWWGWAVVYYGVVWWIVWKFKK